MVQRKLASSHEPELLSGTAPLPSTPRSAPKHLPITSFLPFSNHIARPWLYLLPVTYPCLHFSLKRVTRKRKNSLGLPKHRLILINAHPFQLVRPIILIQHIVRILAQFLHVRTHEHLTELDEIAVLLIVDFNHAPRVGAPADLAVVGRGYGGGGADDCEGDFGLWG